MLGVAMVSQDSGWTLPKILTPVLRFVTALIFCLNPVTSIIVLGWLTQKTNKDVESIAHTGKTNGWPELVRKSSVEASESIFWWRWFGSLWENARSGAGALVAVAILTLPFSLVWLTGWFAGWEVSFNKAYELSGIWPGFSLLVVFLSLPVLVFLPMAITHQAVEGRIASVFEVKTISKLIRASGWHYLFVTIVLALIHILVFGARGLPVFAEQFSLAVQSGQPEAIEAFRFRMQFIFTALLLSSLLLMRWFLARTYVAGRKSLEFGQASNIWKTVTILILCGFIWLGHVFLIYAAQFLNYNDWHWLNQPAYMLPTLVSWQ